MVTAWVWGFSGKLESDCVWELYKGEGCSEEPMQTKAYICGRGKGSVEGKKEFVLRKSLGNRNGRVAT